MSLGVTRLSPRNNAAQRVPAGLVDKFIESKKCITVNPLFYGPPS